MKYRCPKCHSTDRLTVLVSVFAWLQQDADGNLQTAPVGDHEWNEDSAAMCMNCTWAGEIGECDTNQEEK